MKCPNCGAEEVPIALCPRCHDVSPDDACGVDQPPPQPGSVKKREELGRIEEQAVVNDRAAPLENLQGTNQMRRGAARGLRLAVHDPAIVDLGSISIGPGMANESVWLQMPDGEGGEFPLGAVAKVLTDFFNSKF